MKYVMLHKAGEVPRVRMGFAPETHKQLAAALEADGFKPINAGFVRFTACGKAETFGESTSLGLKPGERDAAFITAFNKATNQAA